MRAGPVGIQRERRPLGSPRLASAEAAKYEQQKIARYQQGEMKVPWDPSTWNSFAGARKVRLQGLRGLDNWSKDLTSPRLQAAERAQYENQKIARYNQGETVESWDPTTWHNVVGARSARMQGLYQNTEPWNLDSTDNRLQAAEKKAYYKLRSDRYERHETSNMKYPSDETWQMPNARGARKVGLYQVMMAPEEAQGLYQVPREGWQADGTDSHLALAEKRKYMRNEWQRFTRGESDGPSAFWGNDMSNLGV